MNSYQLIKILQKINRYNWSFGLSYFYNISNEESALFEELWKLIEQLAHTKEDRLGGWWKLWLCCDGCSAEQAEELCILPDEPFWVEFGAVTSKTKRAISFDRTVYFQSASDMPESDPIKEMPELLEWLITAVSERIEQLKKGTYNDIIEKNLSYRKRFGIIDRKDLWNLYPNFLEDFCDNSTKEEQELFLNYFDKQDEIQPLSHMTAEDYYRYCEICYQALNVKYCHELPIRELYRFHSDGRGKKLSEVAPDNEEKFIDWAMHPYEHHQFEIIEARIYLSVKYSPEIGFILQIGCEYDSYLWDAVRCYIALRNENIPVVLSSAERYADNLRGKGKIGIEGVILGYPYRKEYDETIFMRRIPYDERFQKVIALTDWKPIPPSSQLK